MADAQLARGYAEDLALPIFDHGARRRAGDDDALPLSVQQIPAAPHAEDGAGNGHSACPPEYFRQAGIPSRKMLCHSLRLCPNRARLAPRTVLELERVVGFRHERCGGLIEQSSMRG